MAGGDERQHAEQDRDRHAARSEPPAGLGEHRLDLLDGVERLGHHQVRTRRELPFEPIPLGRRVGGGRIERTGDREPGPLADRPAGRVLGEVEPGEDLDQPDRIDVPDAGPGRVVADPRRVAGQRDDVADAERVGAEQLRLEGHQVPVPRRAVDEALEVEIVLDPEGHRQGAHPDPGHRRVGDVDHIDAGVAQEPGGLDRPLDPDAARRVDLDRDDEAAGVEELGQARRRRRVVGGATPSASVRRGRRPRSRRCGLGRGGRGGSAAARGRGRVERRPHRGDVLRRRPAAAADDPGSGGQQARRHGPEVLGARGVDEAALEPLRQSGVGHDRPRGVAVGRGAHRLERVEAGRGSGSAVDPDRVGSRRGRGPSAAAPGLLPSARTSSSPNVSEAITGTSEARRASSTASTSCSRSEKVSSTIRSAPPSSKPSICSRNAARADASPMTGPPRAGGPERPDRAADEGVAPTDLAGLAGELCRAPVETCRPGPRGPRPPVAGGWHRTTGSRSALRRPRDTRDGPLRPCPDDSSPAPRGRPAVARRG